MLKYQKGYIFNGHTFVVNKEDVHNETDDMFVEATVLLPVSDVVPDVVPVVRCGECRRATRGGGGYVWCGSRTMPLDGFCSYGKRKEGTEK